LRGAAEGLACDVVTEVEPRPGGPGVRKVFVFAAVIGLARVLVAKCALDLVDRRELRERPPPELSEIVDPGNQ